MAAPVPGANDGVTTQELLQFLHIFLFVFWLGPDVAAYIWSRKAARRAHRRRCSPCRGR
jgi:hypothetical protein